jgi:hypothetical protein
MPTITIRNLPEETHRALRVQLCCELWFVNLGVLSGFGREHSARPRSECYPLLEIRVPARENQEGTSNLDERYCTSNVTCTDPVTFPAPLPITVTV